LEAKCKTGAIAALIVEPLILGAGGMLIYDASTLYEMRRICAEHNVLFIADEVMTGFGRTGAMFACDSAGIEPDILCLAKGLTGGSLPLAATLCRPEIFEAHYAKDRAKTFFHSSSYTANPICCAAAVANLAIWLEEHDSDRLLNLAAAHAPFLVDLANDARFTNVRQLGTIAALDLNIADKGYLASAALALRQAFLKRGVLLRPLGTTIYIMPPYCTTSANLAEVYAAISEVAGEVLT
jgi:adenosylmethionine-8-amino-7-oxononanoate aminotransferase